MSDSLTDFLPTRRRITVAGREIALRDIPMRDYPAFMAAIRPALPLVMQGRLLDAAADHGAGMLTAVEIGTDADLATLEGLMPHEFLAVLDAVAEHNMDFYLRHLEPALRGTATRLMAAMSAARAGVKSSPS